MSSPTVVTEIVAKSLCCGCGVCAGVCPQGALEMQFNSRGELVPAVSGACGECRLCLTVCPALDIGEPLSPEEIFGSASAARKDPHIGRFVESLVGFSPRHREKGASGGMAMWTLEELLRQRKINAAVCVGRSERKDRLFEPVVVLRVRDLQACAGSKYYPVEFSSALVHIRQNEGKYAIVALPCAVTAIRKAQRAVPLLRRRISYVFALVCGHGASKQFTNFLLAVVGLAEETTRSVDFRYMGRSATANNYGFRAQNDTRRWSSVLLNSGLYGRLWAGRFFVPKACEFCDDLFAPLADATFMDAWLPECVGDVRGTSIVVVRQPGLAGLFRKAQREGSCHLRPIAPEHIRRAQGGALTYKTVYLPLRVARAERDGLSIPRSLPRGPVRGGLRERLATIKHAARDRLCRWTFRPDGRSRAFWVSVLTGFLRGQSLWRAARRGANRVREFIVRLKPGGTTGK